MNLLDWLPITKKETDLRGWNEVDIVIITGDAYVDHPAFGAAVIGPAVAHIDHGHIFSADQRRHQGSAHTGKFLKLLGLIENGEIG
mgnify:CR=1 FL=1